MEFNMNRKVILLAGAAMFMAFSANAMDINPYIGLDYVYSKASFKNDKISSY